MKLVIISTLLMVGLGVGGCTLKMPEGQFECEKNNDCPAAWFCDTDQLCYQLPDTDTSDTGQTDPIPPASPTDSAQ